MARGLEVLSQSSASFEPLYPLIEPVQALIHDVQPLPYPFPELVLCHPSLRSSALLVAPEAASSTPLAVSLAASLASTTAALSCAAAFPISSPVHAVFLLLASMTLVLL